MSVIFSECVSERNILPSYFAIMRLKDEGERCHIAMIHRCVRILSQTLERREIFVTFGMCMTANRVERMKEKVSALWTRRKEVKNLFKHRCLAVPLEDIGSK